MSITRSNIGLDVKVNHHYEASVAFQKGPNDGSHILRRYLSWKCPGCVTLKTLNVRRLKPMQDQVYMLAHVRKSIKFKP
jgi:phage FluMu protein Com